MGWNLPDDWGCYYNQCERCGHRYHASEGSCSCLDKLECQCGQNMWDRDEVPTCRSCGTHPYEEGRTHVSIQVAKKDHGRSIKRGDQYRRVVSFGHFPGGAFTLRVAKVRLQKGPAWTI